MSRWRPLIGGALIYTLALAAALGSVAAVAAGAPPGLGWDIAVYAYAVWVTLAAVGVAARAADWIVPGWPSRYRPHRRNPTPPRDDPT